MNVLTSLHTGLAGLGEPSVLGWLVFGAGLLWLNVRSGLPRARRDLQLRGLGVVLFVLAAVLDLGRGLVAAWPWPWPPQTALLGTLVAPLAAGWLLRRGRWGLAALAGLSFPLLALITVTAFFGLWLDLALVGGAVLAVAWVLSVAGALLTWRTPKSADSPFGAFGNLGGAFVFGPGGFRRAGPGRARAASNDDIVDVEARDIDAPPPPSLPRRDG